GTAHAMAGDAGNEAGVKGFIDKAVSAFGALDIVHANAGVSGGRVPIFEQTEEYWRQILQINLIRPVLAIKQASMPMVEQGRGSIILTSSVAGLAANAGAAAYSASKAGVISLAQNSRRLVPRHRRARQRHLPRPDRNRHDQAVLRQRPRSRQGTQNRSAQSAA